jgi:hypothetical protein
MIKLKNTPEQIELLKRIGSKVPAESREAMEAFAAAIGPVISQVLEQAGTASLVYTDQPFSEDESPSYALDLFYNEDVNYVNVWSQKMAGGLPTSEIAGVAELKIATYRLDSAVSFLQKYARKHNLNVLSKAVEKMLQEVLIKQERQAWAVVLRALGEANTKVNGVVTKHTIASTTQNIFQVDDLSRLITLAKRINSSFAGGTPVAPYSRGITDLFGSPEIKEQVRSFSYNPMNTRGVPNSDESTAVPLPDAIRQNIFNSVGMDEIFGINIHDLNELGLGYKYNVLFGNYATAGIAAGGANFSTTTDEILVGIDLTKDALVRAIATDADNGSTFSVKPDDQWVSRDEKVGFYGSLEEGRICIDARAILGLVV